MNGLIHLYCDESCHLEKDRQNAMALGAVSCPADVRKRVERAIKSLKKAYGIPTSREIKWAQISPSNLAFYRKLIDLFFDESRLGFRGVVVPDKNTLEHARFDQSHDDFYYKMWWLLLTRMIDDEHGFRIFVDIKDTHSAVKLTKLHEVLCNAHYDFDNSRIKNIEAVHSHDVVLVQMADVLAGALSHLFRRIDGSKAKQALIAHVQTRSGLTLAKSTPPAVRKFNLFIWQPQERA
ncbi:conserved hypothetical protein [Nitrosococcus halophilus Nc 4]|uniref:DUF3800 domain-containing protein n=1 Tax=Nitrosococcus halophilus (strain Nc4) TaxID=472759 RepID=D5BZ01_NITHN|nr:DUF3800 domain-containing protein [Nitrosococcus halophilus]ADE14214.1 conserved hypothetical protein [Nitrosococcus halophilus Nc 4]